jgi:hypothetical protein
MILDNKEKAASLLLRFGLAFVFAFAAYTSIIHPESYYKYVPGFIIQFIPINIFLMGYGVFEFILALWLLTGKFALYSALISALLLCDIVFFNLTEIDTLFRNVAIITSALALALLSLKPKTPVAPPVVSANPIPTPAPPVVTPPAAV